MNYEFEKVYSDMKQGCLIISCTQLENGTYPAYWPDTVEPNQFVSEEVFQQLSYNTCDCVDMALKPICGFEKVHKFIVCFESKLCAELLTPFRISYEDNDLMGRLVQWSKSFETTVYTGSSSFSFLQDYFAVRKPLYKIINLGKSSNGIEIAAVDAEVYEKMQTHFLYESISIDSYEFVGGNKDNKYRVTFSNGRSFIVFEGDHNTFKTEYEVEPHYKRRIKEYLKR